jgi:ribosomal protein L11 methyltransferase
VNSGLGIDLDACARFEASENVRLNALQSRADISAQALADVEQRFFLICANLRYPSLCKMVEQIDKISEPGGLIVVSGIKDDELDDLLNVYQKRGFGLMCTHHQLGWAGVVLQRVG